MIDKNKIEPHTLSVRQKSQKRYENQTFNKPCTVRAHPHEHAAIKKFAKTGHCTSCKENLDLTAKFKRTLIRQKNGPIKWTDQCTHRDAVLSTISASFVVVVFILYSVVNEIFM